MAYCTNCGHQLNPQANFCPACGTKIASGQGKPYASGYKEKMFKGAEQKLQNITRNRVRSTIQKNFTPPNIRNSTVSEKIMNSEPIKKSADNIIEQKTAGGVTIWTWLYLIINVILAVKGFRIDEVLGILFISFIILLFVFVRIKNEKPYNWFIKIFIIAQMVFLAAMVYLRVMEQNFTFIALLLAVMLIVDFKLLFKGNKN